MQDPNFLIGPAVTHETGAVDAQKWKNPDVIETILKLAPELPYLRPLLIAFFEAAGKTWQRFTSEFAPGGLIDETTTEEKELAWMPPTNDANEGALGAFRVLIRHQPQLTQLQYNAQAMFCHNKTQESMNKTFEHDDYQFVCKMAHEADTQGQERS